MNDHSLLKGKQQQIYIDDIQKSPEPLGQLKQDQHKASLLEDDSSLFKQYAGFIVQKKKNEAKGTLYSVNLFDFDQAEKAQAELQKALQMTKSAMESRIAEIDEEKASAVQAVTNEMVQASREAGKQKVGEQGVTKP